MLSSEPITRIPYQIRHAMPAGAIAGSAGLPEYGRFRTGQCIPEFDVGRDVADGSQKLLLAVIAAPPSTGVELDEMRAPALRQRTPLPGDFARIPNIDFSGHDRRNEYAMEDDAIRRSFTRNQRTRAGRIHCRPDLKVSRSGIRRNRDSRDRVSRLWKTGGRARVLGLDSRIRINPTPPHMDVAGATAGSSARSRARR